MKFRFLSSTFSASLCLFLLASLSSCLILSRDGRVYLKCVRWIVTHFLACRMHLFATDENSLILVVAVAIVLSRQQKKRFNRIVIASVARLTFEWMNDACEGKKPPNSIENQQTYRINELKTLSLDRLTFGIFASSDDAWCYIKKEKRRRCGMTRGIMHFRHHFSVLYSWCGIIISYSIPISLQYSFVLGFLSHCSFSFVSFASRDVTSTAILVDFSDDHIHYILKWAKYLCCRFRISCWFFRNFVFMTQNTTHETNDKHV